MQIISTIVLSILAAVGYRAGGWGGEGRDKFPNLPGWFFNTKARDIFIPILGFSWIAINRGVGICPWYIHLLCFLLLFAALTTYHDWF